MACFGWKTESHRWSDASACVFLYPCVCFCQEWRVCFVRRLSSYLSKSPSSSSSSTLSFWLRWRTLCPPLFQLTGSKSAGEFTVAAHRHITQRRNTHTIYVTDTFMTFLNGQRATFPYTTHMRNAVKIILSPQRKLSAIRWIASMDFTQWQRCIVGDVGKRFWNWRGMCQLKKRLSLVQLYQLKSFVFKLSIFSPAVL